MSEYAKALRRPTIGGNALIAGPLVEARRDGRVLECARVSVPQEFAQAWTVTLAPHPPDRFANTDSYAPELNDVFAQVQWGNGGEFAVAEVDWGRGQAFTVCGSEVVVSARCNPPPPAVGWPDLTSLAAFITPGANNRPGSPPTRSVDYEIPGPAGTNTIHAVPPFAKRWFLMRKFNVSGGVCQMEVQFRAAAGVLYWQGIVEFANVTSRNTAQIDQWYPVPPGATICRVQNNDAADRDCVLIYELGL